jgi:hypothetical protein
MAPPRSPKCREYEENTVNPELVAWLLCTVVPVANDFKSFGESAKDERRLCHLKNELRIQVWQ